MWLFPSMADFSAFVPIPLPFGAMQYNWVAFCNTNASTVLYSLQFWLSVLLFRFQNICFLLNYCLSAGVSQKIFLNIIDIIIMFAIPLSLSSQQSYCICWLRSNVRDESICKSYAAFDCIIGHSDHFQFPVCLFHPTIFLHWQGR